MKKFILLSAVVMFFGITADTFGQRRVGEVSEKLTTCAAPTLPLTHILSCTL